MPSAGITLRRATLDDLPELKRLWARAGLPVLEEERHLTEFQVMLGSGGDLIGAVGLHIEGKMGKMHSEAFVRPEEEEALRPRVWERVKGVAKNHGLARIWTQETSPYWHQEAGFVPATENLLRKLPSGFGDRHAQWRTVSLRDEGPEAATVDREFERFQAFQQESTEQVLRQARQLKVLAYVVLVVAVAAAGYVVFRLVRGGPNLLEMLPR